MKNIQAAFVLFLAVFLCFIFLTAQKGKRDKKVSPSLANPCETAKFDIKGFCYGTKPNPKLCAAARKDSLEHCGQGPGPCPCGDPPPCKPKPCDSEEICRCGGIYPNCIPCLEDGCNGRKTFIQDGKIRWCENNKEKGKCWECLKNETYTLCSIPKDIEKDINEFNNKNVLASHYPRILDKQGDEWILKWLGFSQKTNLQDYMRNNNLELYEMLPGKQFVHIINSRCQDIRIPDVNTTLLFSRTNDQNRDKNWVQLAYNLQYVWIKDVASSILLYPKIGDVTPHVWMLKEKNLLGVSHTEKDYRPLQLNNAADINYYLTAIISDTAKFRKSHLYQTILKNWEEKGTHPIVKAVLAPDAFQSGNTPLNKIKNPKTEGFTAMDKTYFLVEENSGNWVIPPSGEPRKAGSYSNYNNKWLIALVISEPNLRELYHKNNDFIFITEENGKPRLWYWKLNGESRPTESEPLQGYKNAEVWIKELKKGGKSWFSETALVEYCTKFSTNGWKTHMIIPKDCPQGKDKYDPEALKEAASAYCVETAHNTMDKLGMIIFNGNEFKILPDNKDSWFNRSPCPKEDEALMALATKDDNIKMLQCIGERIVFINSAKEIHIWEKGKSIGSIPVGKFTQLSIFNTTNYAGSSFDLLITHLCKNRKDYDLTGDCIVALGRPEGKTPKDKVLMGADVGSSNFKSWCFLLRKKDKSFARWAGTKAEDVKGYSKDVLDWGQECIWSLAASTNLKQVIVANKQTGSFIFYIENSNSIWGWKIKNGKVLNEKIVLDGNQAIAWRKETVGNFLDKIVGQMSNTEQSFMEYLIDKPDDITILDYYGESSNRIIIYAPKSISSIAGKRTLSAWIAGGERPFQIQMVMAKGDWGTDGWSSFMTSYTKSRSESMEKIIRNDFKNLLFWVGLCRFGVSKDGNVAVFQTENRSTESEGGYRSFEFTPLSQIINNVTNVNYIHKDEGNPTEEMLFTAWVVPCPNETKKWDENIWRCNPLGLFDAQTYSHKTTTHNK